jgi:hypothetical protein
MYRDVGFADGDPASLDEIEALRHAQDRNAFDTIVGRYPELGFTPANLLVLLQPQYMDGEGDPIPYGKESYMASLRELAQFIAITTSRVLPPFSSWNSVMMNVSLLLDKLAPGATLDVTHIRQHLWAARANEVAQGIINRAGLRIKREIEGFGERGFPFDQPVNPK